MSNLKTKKKSLTEIEQTKPAQLELFKIDDQNSESFSNTIEIYDMMPKYHFGGVERKMDQYLDVLEREFVFRERKYNLNISPAAIVDKKTGKTIYYYPSQREELVEDVLRKLSASKERGVYLDGEAGVKFTLYEVQKELEKIGHGYNINQIKQAIEICSKTGIEIRSKDGAEISYISNIFPLAIIDRAERADGKNMAAVMFHPLVTKSINEGTFRLINYERMMSMKMPLARWLHKRISHLFSQATVDNPYKIKLSTIVRDSGMKVYKTISERIRQVSKAMDELKEAEIISKYEINPDKQKNKILDATYLLYVSEEFVADVKKANAVTNSKLKREKISDISEGDLIELRTELIRDTFGLSLTVINNIIGKVSTKKNKDEIMLALKAAEEWMETNSGKEFHPAQITMAAIKNKYIPKSALNISQKKESKSETKKKPDLFENQLPVDRSNEWNLFMEKIKKEFDSEIFKKWLSKLELLHSYEVEIVMQTSTKFLRDWIKREYLPKIREIWQEIDNKITKVSIVAVEDVQ